LKRLGVVGGGVHFVIVSITQPFFALYASDMGASTALIGFMITLKAFLPLFIAMPTGQLIDRVGAPKILNVGSGITVASLMLMVWSPTLMILALSQLLIGAGMLLIASSLQVIVSEGDKAEREKNITRYSSWSSAGSMVGPLIGGGLVSLTASNSLFGWSGTSELGYRIAFLFSLMLSTVFMLSFMWYTRKQQRITFSVKEVKALLGPREMMRSYLSGAHLMKVPGIQFGLVGTFLIHYLQSIWMSFFPLYLDSLGYGAIAISVLVSVRGLAGLISRSFLPFLTKQFNYESILIGAGCIAALSVIALPALNFHIILVGTISFILGSAVGVNMPVSTIIMVNETQQNERGKVMGLRLLTNRASQIAAPAMFGVIGQTMGLTLAFYTGGGVLLASILAFGAYSRIRFKEDQRAGIMTSEYNKEVR
jgi:MFS family permease